jgi:hypothetical protein
MRANFRRIVMGLLVLASLFSVVRYWRLTLNIDRGKEALDAWEARLAPAREALPFQRGVIGYVADWDVPGVSYAYADQEGEYLLAQYTLAPLILKKGPAAEWNVAVLSPKSFAAWQAAFGKQFEVSNIGHNVYILRKLENP